MRRQTRRKRLRAPFLLLLLASLGCKAAVPPVNQLQSSLTASPTFTGPATTPSSRPNESLAVAEPPNPSPIRLTRFNDENAAADVIVAVGEKTAAANPEDEFSSFATLLDSAVEETPAPVQSFTVDSLIATALSNHPSVAAARQRLAAAENRIPQVTALPDPTFSNTFWPIHDQALQTAGGRVGNQMTLGQRVPWPTKLGTQGSVAAREVQMAIAEVEKVQLEITERVRLAYYDLWLADRLIQIVQDNEELVTDLIAVTEARYQPGGSQKDILRAELEADRLAEQRISLRRRREQAQADLGALVGNPIEMGPIVIDDLEDSETSPRIDDLIALAERCNPTLQGLAAQISRDREKQHLACLQQYPDLQFGIGWSLINDNHDVISPVANGHDNLSFTVGVTLPIWREKLDAAVREAAHHRSSSALERDAQRDQLRGTLRRQVAAAYAAVDQLELFRDRIIPRVEQVLEITSADYQGKKAEFSDLVDIYRELLATQVSLARTKATLASTLAQIERTVGCPL